MKSLITTLFILLTFLSKAQINCEAYRYLGDTLKYRACLKAEERTGHYQFAKEYQMALDESLKIDSTFDYAYKAKSTAYLKSGDFLEWKRLMDKAVALDPKAHLGYRGWCRFQFFRDYEGAISDIQKLDSLTETDIGYSQNGTYHLNVALGLCYKMLGDIDGAINIIKEQIRKNEEINFPGGYDYLHLGVLYLYKQQYDKALEAFQAQSLEAELAENEYYKALTLKAQKRTEEGKKALLKARDLYIQKKRMFDPYSNPLDKIYLSDIEKELTQ